MLDTIEQCQICGLSFDSTDIKVKIQYPEYQTMVHRHCVLIAEHEAAAAMIAELRNYVEAEQAAAVEMQCRHRACFYRDHNDSIRREKENRGRLPVMDNIVEEAAGQSGYRGREREWASEVLLREAQRIVFGPPAILAGDWEGEAKEWHNRATNLREYVASMSYMALRANHPTETEENLRKKALNYTARVEREGYLPDEPAIQIVKTVPGGKRGNKARN